MKKNEIENTVYRDRNCLSSRSCRFPTALRAAINGARIILSSHTSQRHERSHKRRVSSLLPVHIDRHTVSKMRDLLFSCLNICSVANKIDALIDVRRDNKIDVLYLGKTWHDSDSVSLRSLRVEGFQVVDRPPPRRTDSMTTNHGGIAAIAAPGVRLMALDSQI